MWLAPKPPKNYDNQILASAKQVEEISNIYLESNDVVLKEKIYNLDFTKATLKNYKDIIALWEMERKSEAMKMIRATKDSK